MICGDAAKVGGQGVRGPGSCRGDAGHSGSIENVNYAYQTFLYLRNIKIRPTNVPIYFLP